MDLSRCHNKTKLKLTMVCSLNLGHLLGNWKHTVVNENLGLFLTLDSRMATQAPVLQSVVMFL